MADKFSGDQIEEWKDYWELFDNEGEGKIYWSQVGSAIRSFGWAPTNEQWQEALNVQMGGTVTEESKKPSKQDLDNKQITFDEFLPVLAAVSELPTTGTKEDFLEGMKVLDKEGNGYVLAVEIQHVLASLGEALKQDEVDEIFKGVEVNSNGAMKYECFVEHFMADPADEGEKK
jgi:Ca2+-binding EF-hand superfamily protein